MGKQDEDEKEGGSLGANFGMGSVSFGYGETRFAPAQAMGGLQLQTKLTTTLTKVTVSVLQLTKTIAFSRKKSLKRTLSRAQATDANLDQM